MAELTNGAENHIYPLLKQNCQRS